jgi:Mg-chelatase subunit ChlD
MKTKIKKKPSQAKTSSSNKPTLVAFLLDRTGSMAGCIEETIRGFNGYIKTLKEKSAGEMRFTLTQFDTTSIDVVHNAVKLSEVKELTHETYQPRAMTPLYDAIGKTIRATESEAGDKYKVLFVTLTDGQENASTEFKKDSINGLIKQMEGKGWTFAYVGIGLEGFGAVSQIAMDTVGASNVLRSSHKNTDKTYARMASSAIAYMSCKKQGSMGDYWGGKNATTEDES